LVLDNAVDGEIADGVGVATVIDDDLDVCTPPAIDESADAEAFLWKHCPSGAWRLRVTGGGEARSYTGRIVADQPFTDVTPVSIESGDSIDTSNPNEIGFSLTAEGDSDGFNFIPARDAGTCFELTAPTGTVLVGGQRLPRTGAIDL